MSVFSLAKIIQLLEKANDQQVSVSFIDDELSVHVQKGMPIDKVLLDELRINKPFLIHYFKNFASNKLTEDVSAIEKIDRQKLKKIPLSFAQERLWFVHQLEGSVQYHLPTVLRLKGKLNTDALEYALQNIVNRHEILRTVIVEEDGKGFQHIKREEEWILTIVDGSVYREDQEAMQYFIRQLITKPFDLSRDDMLRAVLISINTEDHVLVVTMHHIASDAWSQSVLVREVVELYAAYIEGRDHTLPDIKIQYADYAVWQRNYLQGEVLNKKLQYWKNKLDGLGTLQLPTDHFRPVIQSARGGNCFFNIDKDTSDQLHVLSQQHGVTLFIALLAVYKVLLYRYSGQQDICVGTSFARREQKELESLIGFFVNTLALRDEVNPQLPFASLLQQVKATTFGAYEHQDIPFEKIVETVVKERDPGRNPLFQVMLVLMNTPAVSQLKLGELEFAPEGYEQNTTKFDITFFITETPLGLQGSVQYSTDLYLAETIEHMVLHFRQLLRSVLKDPQQKIATLQMLTHEEEQILLVEFNDSKVTYPTTKSVVDLFEEQAEKMPGATAVVFAEETLTYRQLNERSNQLAHYLKSIGIKQDSLVPLYVERSAAMMIAMLGIMKAGAAYVPIDTEFPAERVSYMLEDTGSEIIVSSKESRTKLPAFQEINTIEIDGPELNDQPIANLAIKVASGQLAYVIYTSGSTGKPKGVMVKHRSLVDYVFGLAQKIAINECSSFGLVSTIATDLGNTVIYASLLSGGALHIFSKESVSNIEYLHRYFSEYRIDCLKIVPSHWRALCTVEELLLPQKLLVFGGEALQPELVERIRLSGAGCRVVNHYGPTETTIGKLLHEVKPGNNYTKTIPVGKPFSNARVYVLSKEMQLCPPGIPGQLYIAGDGVARGYFNNPDLTKEKFITDPFSKEIASKMYATGDLVKWLADGNIEFIGRVDDQVKIRGYRIELGEIETVLQKSEFVSQSVVLAREDKQGNKRLVGYIVPEGAFEREGILNYLKEQLPDYMIPAVLIDIERLPLTANGKVNRKSLPDPDTADLLTGQYIAPRNDAEARLALIWKDVLEVEQVGMHDDFFELGGHSLLAVRLISAIRKAFAVEMPIGDIFDYPTVALMAEQVAKLTGTVVLPAIEVLTPRPQLIPLSFSQERLWFIDQLEGSVQYHVPAIFRLKGRLNKEALTYGLQQIINRHEILRTVIYEQEGRGYQFINNKEGWLLNRLEGTQYKEDRIGLHQFISHLVNKPFDLAKDYMLRGDLVMLDEEEHMLVITLHHIASDGWSASIIVKELVELWKAYEEGREAALADLPLQYADFAIWQRTYIQGEVLENKLAFWKANLQGVEPLQLPTDFVRPLVPGIKGAFTRFFIDKELADAIKLLSQQEGTSLFMTLLAAFKVLLFRYSGQQDICVGTPIAGRQQQELEGLIGFFINTLALRSELTGTATFRQLLQQVRTNTLQAYEHQDVPFEKVVEAVVKEREMSRSPLFQVMFILQNTPRIEALHLGELELIHEPNEHDTTKFELTFSMAESDDGMSGAVEYCTDLYSAKTIEKMIVHFKELLNAVVTMPQQTIATLPMLTAPELLQLQVTFNDTEIAYPKEKSIIDFFEEQVAKSPETDAVVFEGKRLTHAELNERSNQLAHYLKSMGIKEDTLVPICIERSIEMVIAVVAVLKAGAAYVPVDPDYPLERVNYIIGDIRATLIITSKAGRVNIQNAEGITLLEIDSVRTEISGQPTDNPIRAYKPNHLAYLIYTSGSTGKPKGVKMPGGALVNLLCWQEKQFVNKRRRVLQFASLNFDVSFQEIFSTLCFGSTLYLINAERRKDVSELLKDLAEHNITHLFVPYIVLKNLADSIVSMSNSMFRLEEVIVAGEQLKLTDEIQFLLKKNIGSIINQYGPTEAHVVSSYTVDVSGILPALPPIGKPIDNTRLYIVGGGNQLVPVGVAGELYIGGVQVAHGYLNQPQQTAEKFIKDCFSTEEDARLYKTGDMARWLPDGNIEYLGRMDDQVKIRGFRIELGEIESVLQECDLIRQAVVMAKNDVNGNKRLVSYIVPQGLFQKDDIIAYAKSKLPEYMIPSLWVQMDNLPVTRNGKIDKKSLPNPDASELIGNAFIAPRNTLETALAEIWIKLLGVEKVGINDNFFELGGHSLLAMRVVSSVRREMEVELAIRDLFNKPTIAALANHIGSQHKGLVLPSITVEERPEHIPLSFSQQRLWFIDRLEGSVHYHMNVVLMLNGKLNTQALEYALQSVISRHEVLRTAFMEEEGKPFQYIKDKDGWDLTLVDDCIFGGDEPQEELQDYIKQLIRKPFDLSKDYMLRAALIAVAPGENLLVLTMHHIASDGWSISVLVKEVAEFYNAFTENRPVHLPELPLQYADYAIWQRLHLEGDVFDLKLRYWKNKLDNISLLQLPVDFQRPAIQSTRGANFSFTIDKELSAALQELSRQQGTTLFMTLLAAFNVLLYRYSNNQDICVGTPIAGRQHKEVEGLIGFFVNTLALRTELHDNDQFTSLLSQVRATTLEAYEHQEIPFERVVEAVVHDRDMSRNPLFQVMLVLQNTPEVSELKLSDVTLSPGGYERTVAKFDMSFFITETDEGINGVVEYCTDLFTKHTINKIIRHFKQLLGSIVKSPTEKIGLLPMLSKEEEARILIEFNDTKVSYPDQKSIAGLFTDQVGKTPGATAILFESEQLSYEELNGKANQLANYLIKMGIREDMLVPICIRRSPEMIVGILGILKAGAAFVPVDPDYPIERINYMLTDTGAKLVISAKESMQKLQAVDGLEIIRMDTDWPVISSGPSTNPAIVVSPHNLAYVIHTSGSTGMPKGVMIEHGAVVNLLKSIEHTVDFSTGDGFLSVTTFSFDICYLEFFVPLINGGRLIIVSREITIDGFRLSESIKHYQPTHMQATPATWQLLLDAGWQNNERIKILIGGEAIKEEIKDALTEIGEVYNLYGPTETTIWSVSKKLAINEKVLIGKPIANTSIYVLGELLQVVPVGVAGEICIGGAGLARGYLNRPELTSQKFISNPFSDEQGSRIYKTGDMGRWLPDGNLECLGRIDDQVKIRGYRIELGEIETVLMESELINQAVVLAREDKEKNKRLVGYYVPKWQVVKQKELELYERQVESWKEIYETEYATGKASADEEFDINIWKDSFTGKPIGEQQMQEWLQDIVEVILSKKPGNVLEIGCGSGLIYYKLAGKVNKYTGTDFSKSSIQHINQRIQKGLRDYGTTELKLCAAHEVTLENNEQVDTIIMNSIVQYFPGEAYMDEVMDRCISLLNGSGRIIIGDVRDNRLLELFKGRLQLQNMVHSVNIREYKWAVEQEVLKEEELCFDPAYFYRLRSIYPNISNVEIKWKEGFSINELTLYRYTVVIHVGAALEMIETDWQNWNALEDHRIVIKQLEEDSSIIALENVPNFRLWQERLLNKALTEKSVSTIGDLLHLTGKEDEETLAIKNILRIARGKGYCIRLLLNEDPLKINLLMEAHFSGKGIHMSFAGKDNDPGILYTNIPLLSDIGLLIQKDLKALLKKRLPEYMVPSELTALNQLPLTNNGKVDRRFLSLREEKAVVNNLNYKAPSNDIELMLATIWQELLRVDRIGIYDNFFELGGHSLLAMRVISAIKKEFDLELAIKDLFQFNTINDLGKYLEIQLNIYSEEKDSTEFDLLYI